MNGHELTDGFRRCHRVREQVPCHVMSCHLMSCRRVCLVNCPPLPLPPHTSSPSLSTSPSLPSALARSHSLSHPSHPLIPSHTLLAGVVRAREALLWMSESLAAVLSPFDKCLLVPALLCLAMAGVSWGVVEPGTYWLWHRLDFIQCGRGAKGRS